MPNLTGTQCGFAPAPASLGSNLPSANIVQPTSPATNGADGYPVDIVEGNDYGDTKDSESEPYAVHSLGILEDGDAPASSASGGTVGNTAEFRVQFREFAVVDINKKWYIISDYMTDRHDAKFTNSSSGGWQDNGSTTALDNAGF